MKSPKVTTDAIIIDSGKVLLIKRKHDPFKDMWALPGGFVEYGETTKSSVVREVKEETNLDVEVIKLAGVYSDPNRDPRGHTITVAYLCKALKGVAKAGDDAKESWWWSLEDLPKLAFDHASIIAEAKNQL